MANINLNTVDGLTRLMNEMNSLFNKKIEAAKLNESVKNIDDISFIECRQIFESVSDKLYETEKGKKLIAKYTKTIKENKDLKSLYLISENIKNINKSKVDNANVFVNEALGLVKNLDMKKINEGIKEIKKVVKESVKVAKMNAEDVNNAINENKALNESIDYVFMNQKDAKNLVEYSNNLNCIVEHVDKNSAKENIFENILDATFGDLNRIVESGSHEEWENAALEKLILSSLAGCGKDGIFEDYKTRCLALIDENLEDEDITTETKSHLSVMKEQLTSKEYIEESANDDILKLANLENTLKN